MTEAEASDKLCGYLAKLGSDAKLIDPHHTQLTEVILAHQMGPRPIGPYVTVSLLADRDVEEVACDSYEGLTIGDAERVVLTRARGLEWLYRIDIFATDPTNYGRLFIAALSSAHANVELAPLVVRSVGRLTRAPQLVNEEWEGRASIDVELGGVSAERMLVDVIEEGDVSLIGQGGVEVIRTITFEKD